MQTYQYLPELQYYIDYYERRVSNHPQFHQPKQSSIENGDKGKKDDAQKPCIKLQMVSEAQSVVDRAVSQLRREAKIKKRKSTPQELPKPKYRKVDMKAGAVDTF